MWLEWLSSLEIYQGIGICPLQRHKDSIVNNDDRLIAPDPPKPELGQLAHLSLLAAVQDQLELASR